MGREYLLLLLGLLLIFTAVLKLKNITADVFMQHSPAHTDSVLTAEAVSWTEMREVVEAGLYEQEEIKQTAVFIKPVNSSRRLGEAFAELEITADGAPGSGTIGGRGGCAAPVAAGGISYLSRVCQWRVAAR